MGGPTAQFLRLVLPDFGWRCLWTLPDRRHYWFQSIDDMAVKALSLDAQGKAVYHANAAFTDKKRRKDHAQGLKAFWLDIDAGPGKRYATGRDALLAGEKWRADVGLPPPLYVNSGGGLHLYWPLRDAVDPAGWQRGADGLKRLATVAGLHADPAVTGDAARILRPPGTHNRKAFDPLTGAKRDDTSGPPRPVVMGPLVEPYDTREILHLLSGVAPSSPLGAPWPGARQATDGPFPVGSQPGRLEDAILGGRLYADSDPDLVAERCRQVSELRTQNLAEPLWYAVLGVLVHCGPPGRARAHAWSRRDARYDPRATEVKLNHAAAAASGPTTCGRFQALHAAGCAECKYAGGITTPVQLGRPLAATVTARKPTDADLPHLPEPFRWKNTRIVTDVPDKDGDGVHDFVISEFPVYIRSFQKAERGEGVSAVFRSWEPAEGWVEFPLPLRDLVGDRGGAALAHQGILFGKAQWGHYQGLMTAQSVEFKAARRWGTRYDQFGWKEGGVTGFALGNELLAAGGSERAHGSPEFIRRGGGMTTAGTLGAWRAAAERLFVRPGGEGHGFMLLCSFASVLYSQMNEPGGTIAHMYSVDSGTGKSTVLDAAGSVWGEARAFQLGERDTTNAKFISMGVLGHLPVLFDENRSRDPESVKELVLQYTIGHDKLRGAADGGLRNDALPWSNLFLSASNLSLVDQVRYDDTEVAHAARIFEFQAQLVNGLGVAEGDGLKQVLRENRGTAGRAFVRAVLGDLAGVKAAVQEALRRFGVLLGAEGEFRYILRLFAAVAVAGRLCRQHGILDLPVEAIMAWAGGIATGAKPEARAALDPADVLGRMINEFLPATLVMPCAPKPGPKSDLGFQPIREPRGELLARYEVDSRRLWIDERAAKTWLIEHHQPFSQLREMLRTQGVLLKIGEKKTLAAGAALPKSQVRTWEIDGAHAAVAGALDIGPVDNVVKMEKRA